jgi:Rha family phage regulatory protein
MGNISVLNQNGTLVVTSRQIAEDFEKRHDSVLRDIENLMSSIGTPQNCGMLFIESEYVNSNNRSFKEYLLTRDGFSLLVMGFTGKAALEWKLKYIEAFNKMETSIREQKQLSPMELLKLQYQAIEEQDKKLSKVEEKISSLEDNMPLFAVDCKEVQSLVRSVGIKVLGGYKSAAYNDNSIRGKVYADIQGQLKRQFGVIRYEAIKRNQLDIAKKIVEEYKAPLVLLNEIQGINNQISFDKEAI